MKVRTMILAFLVAAGLFLSSVSGAECAEKKEGKSDVWLEAQLFTTYLLNRHLNPFDFDIDIRDGVAHIKGTVDNTAERDLAVEIARGVEGIKEVKSEITVDPEGRVKGKVREESDFSRKVRDATITANVKMRLLWNRNTSGLDIDVDTKNGEVTLTGEVGSDIERDLAGQLAKNTSGVRKVKNKLTFSPGKEKGKVEKPEGKGEIAKIKDEASDAWITARVKMQLILSKEAEGSDIDVDTANGVVSLKGTVIDREQKEKVLSIVRDNKYVREVKDDLKIK